MKQNLPWIFVIPWQILHHTGQVLLMKSLFKWSMADFASYRARCAHLKPILQNPWQILFLTGHGVLFLKLISPKSMADFASYRQDVLFLGSFPKSMADFASYRVRFLLWKPLWSKICFDVELMGFKILHLALYEAKSAMDFCQSMADFASYRTRLYPSNHIKKSIADFASYRGRSKICYGI